MRIFYPLLLSVLFISGCVSTTNKTQQERAEEASFATREELLISTRNNEKLIEFYKESLREGGESADLRIKLVSAYINVDDYDSAAFHIEQVKLTDDKKDKEEKEDKEAKEQQMANVLFLKAKINFAIGKADEAFSYATQALELSPGLAEVENLLGLIWADKGDFDKSREYFLLARMHFFDDIAIKNNLAVLDMLQKDYQGAIARLEPIYHKGSEDSQVLSNLALAYAKSGLYEPMRTVLKGLNYTDNQIQEIFIALRTTETSQTKSTADAEVVTEYMRGAESEVSSEEIQEAVNLLISNSDISLMDKNLEFANLNTSGADSEVTLSEEDVPTTDSQGATDEEE